MRSTKAWQMEAGSFETIVAAMVSVQVCTYHYFIMCTQALAQYRAEKEMRTKKKKTTLG